MKVGAIAYRKTPGGIEFCLVSSRRHKGKMTFPKGIVKRGEALVVAARRELHEEAGLRGKVKQKSQPVCYHPRTKGEESVLYFLIKVTEVAEIWPEADQRTRVFATLGNLKGLSLGDAPKQLRRHLKRLPRFVERATVAGVKPARSRVSTKGSLRRSTPSRLQ